MKRHLKHALLGAVSAASRRHAVLLPPEAVDESGLAQVEAPYRVDGDELIVTVVERGRATVRATFAAPGHDAWTSPPLVVDGRGVLALDLGSGTARWNGVELGTVAGGTPVTARRFAWHLEVQLADGGVRRRTTSHYAARHGRPVDEAYFHGEDYRDHERESEAVHEAIVALAARHGAASPLLEIGCATGGTLAALRGAGLDVMGLDASAWAVQQAEARLGAGVVWACDVERDPLPGAVTARAPFGALVLASVFEHFHEPFAVVDTLTPLMRPGAPLLIITTNAGSLTHRVFERDWEGYFDWTHHGVERITPRSLRDGLSQRGWAIDALWTWHLWDCSTDPTHACFRDWFAADARFRQLLAERELGDFVTCVARRRDD